MCGEVICDTKKIAETDMIRMNHEMAMLLDTVKEYDDTPVQQACCDVLGKVRQVVIVLSMMNAAHLTVKPFRKKK